MVGVYEARIYLQFKKDENNKVLFSVSFKTLVVSFVYVNHINTKYKQNYFYYF